MRFKIINYINNEDMQIYSIKDNGNIFANIMCVNPTEEELDHFNYICNCLNSLDKSCQELANSLEKTTDELNVLRTNTTTCIKEQIRECESIINEYKDKEDTDSINKMLFTKGKMEAIQVFLNELVKK